MKRIKLLLLSFLFILTSCSSPTATPGLGIHEISPLFKKFYEAHGGLRTFGTTVTPEITENEIKLQYFQNLRLEYHPQLPEGNRVIISNLGAKFKNNQTPCIKPQAVEPKAYFFNDCHSVIKAVQLFFNRQGGLSFFGYPISELAISNSGQLVQHFERASIIWDSKKPLEYQFGLLDLGQIACNELCLPEYRSTTIPLSPPTAAKPSVIQNIALKTQPEFPLLIANKQQQSLFAWVTDEKGAPVLGATVSFSVQLPGNVTRYLTNPTDSKGYATTKIEVRGFKAGDFIFYKASATYNGLTSTDNGYFVAWDN